MTSKARSIPMFPALSLLEKQLPPLRYSRQPLWRLPAEQQCDSVYIPAWNWTTPHDYPEDVLVRTLDTNGAYLAAAGSATIAHSHLKRTGPIAHLEPGEVMPGYYRIRVPHWSFSGTIVSPLGNSARVSSEEQLWVPAPTLILLLELDRDGYLGGITITDSLTAQLSTTFRTWVKRLQEIRSTLLDDLATAANDEDHARAGERYDAFKEGYSAALAMILTGTRCATKRPDWTHTVHAQHAASQWRKAWRYSLNSAVIAMGDTDELTILESDFLAAVAAPKPPFRYDSSGRTLGAFKTKYAGPRTPSPVSATAPATPALDDDGDLW